MSFIRVIESTDDVILILYVKLKSQGLFWSFSHFCSNFLDGEKDRWGSFVMASMTAKRKRERLKLD
jgi:hypothetical protein